MICLLHNAVVDRDRATLREDLFDSLILLIGAEFVGDAVEECMVLGQMLSYSRDDILDFPDEDARIPEELARLHKYLSQL